MAGDSISAQGWSCQKCGRGGLTSVTFIGGLATCGYCALELSQKQAAPPSWSVPHDGPGLHAWDLRALRVSEAENAALRSRLAEAEMLLRELTDFSFGAYDGCVWCEQGKPDHLPGCALAAFLASGEAP